ncbi:L-2-hydroxyglutarate oxidase [Cyclobacterium xiamenense]|uniref:L-2-hydroxyglutarate oxidase n=1 Tax=Cyclobacterium xiamenense TaxID=1297121 RepID=A0A1H6UFR9_9BACT|nr:L-2-hydroxyglutarate oxidase [Cyclobacterium xiamenense]SEI90476.1 L-2-hydroxyglutarate oxidase [Cyclobacterium xiamenense]
MRYDITIIGGGIVGLATGMKLKSQRPDLSVLIVEKEPAVARHQTGNNSGVIHSGLYYKPGSLKAKNCIDGYRQLVAFCERHAVPFEITGKVVVATEKEQLPQLNMLLDRGLQNGLVGVRSITREELKEYEPYCEGVGALHVPQTGIVDYKAVALAYAREFEQLGGVILTGNKVLKISNLRDSILLTTSASEIQTRLLVNCAGLYADKIAALHEEVAPDIRIIPFRGEYFKIKKERQYLVKNLIYPVPDPNFPFLGVHFTRMMKGGVEAGPNAVLAFKKEGYKKSDFSLKEFYEAVSWPGLQKVAAKYWKTGLGEYKRSFSKKAFTRALQALLPDIQESDLEAGGAGVRAQACDKFGGLLDDFAIYETAQAVHVLNAPSPAATSALSIGDKVSAMVLAKL